MDTKTAVLHLKKATRNRELSQIRMATERVQKVWKSWACPRGVSREGFYQVIVVLGLEKMRVPRISLI